MAETTGDSIFKVLSGNQLGAEVFLSDGTYSFGSGSEADIQLDDVALQPLHGYVRLRDGKVELRAGQGDLMTASGLSIARGDEVWREIAQMDAVSAGLSKFVIAGQSANWSSLGPPPPDGSSRKAATRSLQEILATLPRQALVGIGSVVAIGVFVGLVGVFSGDAAPRNEADLAAEALARLRQEIGAMPFADQVKVIERADGTIAIEGYVEEQVERRAIQNGLDASGLPATLRVFVLENLRADVQGTIDSLQIPANFTLDPAGNLTLSGNVLDPLAAERLLESIETGVFGLASVKSEIRTADAILSDLRAIASDAGLADLVIFRLDGLVVEATGIVPRDKMDNWVGLIGVYSRRFASEIPLRSFVTLDQPAEVNTAPVIIGAGPVADAELGRVVAPETLAEPNEVDAQSLFAGQPVPPTTPQPARPSGNASQPDASLSNLSTTLDLLQERRPDLFEQLVATIDRGETPEPTLLQEMLQAVGGTVTAAPQGGQGGGQVVVPEVGPIGTLEGIADDLRRLIDLRRSGEEPSPTLTATTALPAQLPVPSTPLRIADFQVSEPLETAAPNNATSAANTPSQDAALSPLATAIDLLQDSRPDLYEDLVTTIEQGALPDPALVQQVLDVVGATVAAAPEGDEGSAQVSIAGVGPIGTLEGIAGDLRRLIDLRRSGEEPSSTPTAATALPAQLPVPTAPFRTADFQVTDNAETAAASSAASSGSTPPQDAAQSSLATALDLLQERRPDLYEELVTTIEQGALPEPALVQEVLDVVGATVATAPEGGEGGAEVSIAGVGPIGTLEGIAGDLRSLIDLRRSGDEGLLTTASGTALPAQPTVPVAPTNLGDVQALQTADGETAIGEASAGGAADGATGGTTEQDGAAPSSTTSPSDPALSNLAKALALLQERQPDLFAELVAAVERGQPPNPEQLEEMLQVVGGMVEPAPQSGQGGAQIVVTGLGPIGTLEEIAGDLRLVLDLMRAEASSPVTASAATALPAQQPVPTSPNGNAVPQVAEAASSDSATAPDGGTLSSLPQTQTPPSAAPPEQAITMAGTNAVPTLDFDPSAPDLAQQGPPADAVQLTFDGAADRPAMESYGTHTIPSLGADQPAITLPLFALPRDETLTMQPMIDAANEFLAREGGANGGLGAVSPNLMMLVAMQNEQLQFGKTLMRLPQPLTALPYALDQSVACWEGARLTPEMVPTALLLLDALSVSNSSDVTGLTEDVRDVVMETALSPDRVVNCLRQTGTAFGEMVGGNSTFLSETARNPDFVEFLFRNVPTAELPLAGASLVGERYVELTDGRKLAEGAAPDITSRIMSIGDLGVLLRTAEGTRIQLYGNGLGWRVAETCMPNDCGMN
jgi:type III secretion system YscD/HrpQ family protein